MDKRLIERLNQLTDRSHNRRRALLLSGALVTLLAPQADARQSALDRRRKRAEKRAQKQHDAKKRKNKKSGKSNKKTGFSADCTRFVISAGPNRTDEFEHIDDDLLIELIPAGGNAKVIFKDDSDSPNGVGGQHLSVDPFSAKVGDRIRIVARNEVAGGCELDEIWLHCLEGKGGKVKLQDAITPAECAPNANQLGVFSDTTVRIKNS